MNNDRRKQLQAALDLMDKAQGLFDRVLEIVEDVRSEESDALDALPDSFRDGDRGEKMQEALAPEIMDVMTNGGSLEPLSDDEIDALCERLNCDEPSEEMASMMLRAQWSKGQ